MAIEPFLNCSDLLASIAFYTEVLDFTVEVPPDPDPASFDSKHAELQRDGDRLRLSAHAGDGVFGNKIYVRVSNLDELYEAAVWRGLNITESDKPPSLRGGPVQQTWGMREFWVQDPDRNVITFGEAI